MSALIQATFVPAASALLRARSSMADDKSTPKTARPDFASGIESRPLPQARSSTGPVPWLASSR